MSKLSSRGFGKGRSPTKFSYTYEDISKLVGCSPAAARKHAQRGHFNPNDLLSVLEFVRDRFNAETSQDMVSADSLQLVEAIAAVKKNH